MYVVRRLDTLGKEYVVEELSRDRWALTRPVGDTTVHGSLSAAFEALDIAAAVESLIASL